MRMSVVLRDPLPEDTRAYAEEKLGRLERHANLHDVRLTVSRDPGVRPPAVVDIVVHLHHTRLVASCQAPTVREAIDRAVDRADEQVRRRQERVGEHKGQIAANARPPRP
jgi:ribosomal subunit interface protein